MINQKEKMYLALGCTCAVFNIVGSYYISWFDKFLVYWYSIALIVLFFCILNCNFEWKQGDTL